MLDILSRAGSFIAIIILGFFLKQIGFFHQSDFHILSRITIRITLPATIVMISPESRSTLPCWRWVYWVLEAVLYTY